MQFLRQEARSLREELDIARVVFTFLQLILHSKTNSILAFELLYVP